MKKFLSAIAAIVFCAMLSACGNGNDAPPSDAAVTTSGTTAAETTTAETSADIQETVPEEPTQTQTETEAVTDETLSETTSEEITETAAETTVSEQITTTAEETEAAEDESADEEEIVADDSEEIAVNNKFADIDEFLSADLFMLDGKTVTADKSLSASIFDTLKGDFYLETSEFDGNSPFKFAKKGSKIMTETELEGKTNKMVITDSKAYTFDHENKIALFISADKELISMYAPEKMGIIPENISKESFVIADVTIAGKAYKFEYSTSSDWAMLYDADGKLYASVKSGDSLDLSLCKFSATSKIPSGTFDIPEDYMQLDLEEMMQNAPPPEEME